MTKIIIEHLLEVPGRRRFFLKTAGGHVFFSGYLSIFCPGYIFLSGSALSGCDNWCLMWRSWSGSEPELSSQPITSLAGCSEPPDWLPGSSTGGKQSRDQSGYHGTGPETGQVDRALWAFKKNPWNVKKLKLFASVFDRDEFFFCSQC